MLQITITPYWIAVAALLLIGVVLLVRGLRGRPELAEPTCAKCGYDLRGIGRRDRGECPECGSNLRAARAIRFGRHRRSRPLFAAGFTMTIIALLMINAVALQRLLDFQWEDLRSNANLIAGLEDNIDQSRIWSQLLDRYYDGDLNDEEIADAIDHVIAHLERGGGRTRFPMGWGQFFETVHVEGRLEDEQIARLARASFTGAFSAAAPDRVRHGREIEFDIRPQDRRLGGFTHIYNLREITIDGEPIQAHSRRGLRHMRGDLSASGTRGISGSMRIDAEPGDYEIVFTIDHGAIESHLGQFGMRHTPGPVDRWPQTLFRDEQVVRMPITVLDDEQSPIELIAPAEHRQAVIDTLRISALRFEDMNGFPIARLVMNPRPNPPVPLSFTVTVRGGEKEYDFGMVRVRGGGHSHSGSMDPMHDLPFDVTSVDVIFRPDPEGIEGQDGWAEIWGEEIVITDVPVIPPRRGTHE